MIARKKRNSKEMQNKKSPMHKINDCFRRSRTNNTNTNNDNSINTYTYEFKYKDTFFNIKYIIHDT